MKKTVSLVLLSLLITSLYSSAVFAESNGPLKDLKIQVKQDRQEIKTDRKDLRGDFQDLKKNVVDKIKNINSNVAKIVQGQVTAKSDTSLTVTKDGKTYMVNVDSNTKIIRHFWGNSTIGEIAVGNQISVYGKFIDDSHMSIQASMIRDLSIMKRLGAFLGKVVSKGTDSFVFETGKHGNQTVSINGTTKIENRTGGTMSLGDINVGDKVRVKGMWDKSNNTVTDTTNVKDFSIPVIVKATPTP